MPAVDPTQPFYLIVTDHDRGVFAVEGPMTNDRPWKEAPRSRATTSAASPAARPARNAMNWRPSIAGNTSWPAFRRAAS
jgi:hypothetical protein